MSQVFESTEQLVSLIKKRREELGITQSELAQLSNLSINGISKFESSGREVKISTLFKLGEILGFKLSLVFDDE